MYYSMMPKWIDSLPWMSRATSAIFGDWMWIRGALVVVCVSSAYTIWLLAFHQFEPGWADLRPKSVEVFTIAALAFGAFSAVVGALNWAADANPVIDVGKPVTLDRKPARYVLPHVSVTLHDVPRWMRPLVARPAPEGCEVRFKYTQVPHGNALFGGARLLGRWNSNPEPVDYARNAPDLRILSSNRRLDKMFPFGEPYGVPVVIKRIGSESCHHFNDESYRYPEWMNPAWALNRGRYRVEVDVRAYRMIHPARATFLLDNEGTEPELTSYDGAAPMNANGEELEIPADQEADVFAGLAESRVRIQLDAVDALDNKLAVQFGVATTVVTIGLGFLAVAHDDLPRATVALAISSGALYLVNLTMFLLAFRPRDWSNGPELADAENYARKSGLREQRWWVADTFKTSYCINRSLYRDKVRCSWRLLAGVLLQVFVNGAALLIAMR